MPFQVRWLVFACAVTQGLAQDQVQSPGRDPLQVFDQARERLVQVIRSLPRFTCLETVRRDYFAPPPAQGHLLAAPAKANCPDVFLDPSDKNMAASDRLRLEVTVGENREIHAWPGADKFDTRPIDEFVDGPISTGGFGGYLVEVFDNPAAHITFVGEKLNRLEYAYRTPREGSHYYIGRSRVLTGHGGSFQIDPETLDIVSLRIETDPAPAETGMCRDRTEIDYHRVKIGEGDLVLPIQSVLQILEPGGRISRATTTFSACHEYLAESSIRFDDDAASSSTPKRSVASAPLAPGIHFTLRTLASIDLDEAAAGDRFSARVTHSSDKKVLPEGTMLSGRITGVRKFFNMRRTQFAVTLQTAEIRNASVPVNALGDLRARTPPPGFRNRGREIDLPPPGGSQHEGAFMFPGDMRVLKAGYETLWVTTIP
ncbi:MAG: hypothetical protein LAO79_12035 [Acidobacteriia bacterium]|nr:hypothetical protein [Terriglobia bacterium]